MNMRGHGLANLLCRRRASCGCQLQPRFHQRVDQIRSLGEALHRELAEDHDIIVQHNFECPRHHVLRQNLWQHQVENDRDLNGILHHRPVPSRHGVDAEHPEDGWAADHEEGDADHLHSAEDLHQELDDRRRRVVAPGDAVAFAQLWKLRLEEFLSFGKVALHASADAELNVNVVVCAGIGVCWWTVVFLVIFDHGHTGIRSNLLSG
mmetsp:Transcript_14963/g.42292  ORF Transcript_14963/g.42292 Transcript_14963/m.42292 type:complete len:207 (+) Transcript_14963:265-885(+)